MIQLGCSKSNSWPLFNDITTTEIDNYLAETSAALTVEHPDYSYLAARIKANALHKETPGFIIATKNFYEDGLLNKEYYKKVMTMLKQLNQLLIMIEIIILIILHLLL